MTSKRLVEWQKLCFKASFILLLSHNYGYVNGIVEISPSVSGIAPVCRIGSELVLTCTVSGLFLRWEFTVTLDDGTHMNFMPVISAGGSVGISQQLVVVNSTRFTYWRLSTQPLTSTMTIHPVSVGLNGVQVTCTNVQPLESATTTIKVIGSADDLQISNFSVHSGFEQFTDQSVTVAVEWSVSLSQVYYHQLLRNASITILPDTEVTAMDMGNRTFLLSLMYNRQYNVSLTQPGICGQPNQTAFIILNYTRCISLSSLVPTNLEVVGYEDPALEGQSISFTCRPGFEINGPKSSTCIENGQWTPNPRDVNCTDVDCQRPLINSNVIATYNSTLMGSRILLKCEEGLLPSGTPTSQCYSNGSWTPDPAEFSCNENCPPTEDKYETIVTAVISSILVGVALFSIGCTGGWFGHKYKIARCTQARSEKNTPLSNTTQGSQPAPAYKDLELLPTSMPKDGKTTFELKENIAYGPLRST